MSSWNSNKTPADLAPRVDALHRKYTTSSNQELAPSYNLDHDFQELVRRLDTTKNHSPITLENKQYRIQMIAMRMRRREGEKMPFDDLHTSLGKEKVFVFVLQNDKPVVFEDDIGLFPSDTLITQLRLIQK